MKSSLLLACFGFFITPTIAMKMNCAFTYIENCDLNCYQCSSQKFVVTKPNQTVTDINGEHLDNQASHDVFTLRIIDQIVKFMPRLGNVFPYLLVLKIWSSHLSQLNQRDIKEFKYLTDLSVSGNNLETLNSHLFEFNHYLRHVDFTRNRIKHVGQNLLKSLNKLVFADFYQNDCISDGAKFSFENLTEKFKEKCKPTNEMMTEEIENLSRKVDVLKVNVRHFQKEIDKREKKLAICQDQNGKEASSARLDLLFPGEEVWDEVWRE